MLATNHNPATGTDEIQALTAGPWSTAGLTGPKLAGAEWAVQLPDPMEALTSLGLARVDTVYQYAIDTAIFAREEVELLWPEASTDIYALFQGAFGERWGREGHPAEDFAQLVTGPLAVAEVSGVVQVEGVAAGCILAERLEGAEVPSLFYRVFGILPGHRRKGLGLGLYRTSLARAKREGFEQAYWCCYASNVAITNLMEMLEARRIAECGYWEGTTLPVRSGWI